MGSAEFQNDFEISGPLPFLLPILFRSEEGAKGVVFRVGKGNGNGKTGRGLAGREAGNAAGLENGFDLALPDDDHVPTEALEKGGVAGVPGCVACKFLPPESGVCLGNVGVFAAGMGVPEAPVYEDDGLVFGQDDVRAAGEVFALEAEAVAEREQEFADLELWLRIFAFYGRHSFVALLG